MSIHTDEVGVYLRFTLQDETGTTLDVSGCSSISIHLRAPDGTTSTKTGSLVTDGTDGRIEYQTEAGVIDQVGDWHYQARCVWASGVDLVGEAKSFNVRSPLVVT